MTIMGSDFFLEALCLRIYDNSEKTNKLLQTVVDIFKEDVADNTLLDTPTNRLYIKVIEELITEGTDLSNEGNVTSLLMKLEHTQAIAEDPTLLNKLTKIFLNSGKASDKRILQIQNKLSNASIWYHSNKHLRSMFSKNQRCAMTTVGIEQEVLLNEVLEHARDLVKAYESNSGSVQAGKITEVDLTNEASIGNAISVYKSQRETNILKTGWQGLNRMCGESGGVALGEFVAYAALPHNCKSKMLLNTARWIATLNTPTDTEGKIPTILYISLEDEVHTNIMHWFRDAYTNAYQKSPDGLTDDEIKSYVAKTFGINGFKLIIIRKLGVFYGYNEWLSTCEELKASGHKIYACLVDYLALMKIDERNNPAKALQQLAGNMKNYAKHEGFALFTGFQLDNNAAQIANSGQVYTARRFGMSHLSDCKAFFKEVDLLIFCHIEKNQNGIPYLSLAWAKHRDANPPAAADLFTAYRFSKFGILDDINGEDQSVIDIYAETSTEETKVSLF